MTTTDAGPGGAVDPTWSHRLTARNTARDSSNPIHDDTVAAAYGFRGGLVPGVDVYAYLTHPPAREWGLGWLRHGRMTARFASPVYDGDDVTVTGHLTGDGLADLALRTSPGAPCATATATRRPAAAALPDPSGWPRAPETARGAPASPESLCAGTALAPLEVGFHADQAAAYLAEIGEELPLYADAGIAHPGWLLRLANAVLALHVRLGPWIHVSSDATFFDLVHDGDRVETLAVVTDEYERKGHRFVALDVLLTADGRPVQRIEHKAIHTPRPPS